MLIGIGQDSHRFTDGKPLVLAGVKIAHPGLEGNSDGDVVYHALVNAISSAIGKGSISEYADELCNHGITNSDAYVLQAMKELGHKTVNNVSISIEAKTPKIMPLANEMKQNIARLLEISTDRVGITATSGEGLTDFGKGLGIQCFCIVTINEN